ncbi:helix-turn-helix domain-containing protein [Bythopirellula polymerisocia]|uniref:helix-turn-helix domain-containing protein n=1 Tax=Bythopirellula polymerisocia TaxID=2528003 RepID=UPI0011B82135
MCKEVYDLSPRQLIAVARLNQIRRNLLIESREATSVKSLATASGVGHLGRFASEYFLVFGERSCETLQRA